MKTKIALLTIGILLSACSLADRYSQPSPTMTNTPVFVTSPTFTVTVFPYQKYIVTTDLEKRSCPSVECANVGYFLKGETVYVESWLSDYTLDECQKWAKIANETYWVCANYLTSPSPSFIPDEVFVPLDYDPRLYVTCASDVPVYGRPAGTKVFDVLPIGTTVRIHEMSRGTLGWAMILKARWVWREYLCEK